MERPSLRRWFRLGVHDSPLLVKLGASLILPSLLSVAVVTAVLSSLYSSRAREDLDRISALHLQGIRSQMEAAVSSSVKLSYLLKGDQALLDSLGTSPEAVLAYSRATTQIAQFLLSTPYVDSIILAHQNRIIYSLYQRDSYREPKERMLQVLREADGHGPRVRPVVRADGELGRVLTFVSNDSNRPDYVDSAAAVNLNLELLLRDLFGSPGAESGDSYAVLDRQGKLLADSHWMTDSGALLRSDDRNRILGAAEPTGSFRTSDGPRNLYVSYARSEGQGFTVVSLVDYTTYMKGIDGLWGQTLAFCAVVVIVLLAGALLIGNRLYLPLDGLFRRIQRLRHAPEPPGTVHDFAYASQVLSWTAEQLDSVGTEGPEVVGSVLLSGGADPTATAGALKKTGLSPGPGDRLLAVVGRIDGPEAASSGLLPLVSLARETIGSRWPCFAFPWKDRDAVALCRIPAGFPLRTGTLEAVVRAWIQAADQRMALSFSVGVGDLVATAEDLRKSHQDALARVRARVFLGARSLVLADVPGTRYPAAGDLDRIFGRLEQAAAAGTRETAAAIIRELLALTAGTPADWRAARMVDAAEVLGRVEGRLGSLRRVPPDRAQLLRSLEECWGVDRVEAWLMGVYDRVRDAVAQVGSVKVPDLVARAFESLDRHFADPMLSAALLADQLSITPQYFSRIFNEHTGSSFPDHLKHLRLEKARTLILSQPGLSLDEVCRASGFRNKTYFTTAFKRRYGVTPGKLRLAQRRETSAS